MPPVSTLRAMFAHNDWARERLMEVAVTIDDDHVDRPFAIGPGSLRAILGHLWSAERFWLDWWLEAPKRPAPTADDRPALRELRDRFRSTAGERNAFLDDMGVAGESRSIAGERGHARRYPLGDMMLHVCDHGCHHRAQAFNMLRHLGAETRGLDYIDWLNEAAVEQR